MSSESKNRLAGLLAGLALGTGGGVAVAPAVNPPEPGTMTWDQQVAWEEISATSTDK